MRILKGSFVFLADLIRELAIPCEVDFVRARSYGSGTTSAGAIEVLKDVETDVRDRHVLVVEDIADTGLTLDVVVARIRAREARVGPPVCAPRSRGLSPARVHRFHGRRGIRRRLRIDYAERYRGLRDIRVLVPDEAG